ncbi:P-loop containing nucleoside triphosphate hydrolase protein [Suillus subalutaceus]|uniref:P-loop containing nucleoside triphosphate hydrolase protein n=1 Tax=Suillus subalutaceus TaxID=48586 RepID=UPI001B870E18|nr:P-loop containing nucleoside triphosphate hydrolase protein [Suillus subalutaceus]KAG1844511.1 P-loop containing nucleoside triphosphate hydrolase protein [Suillus subalutaceus]
MNRTAQLEKRFNDILRGKVPADARSYALFLEAICTQQDPAACINKITESSHGSSAVQAAMRHNTNSQFLNGTATTLLTYLFRATDLGDVLDQLLVAIVDPPIFWTAFSQAFDQGELNEPAQEAFAVLLLRLMCLTTGNTSSYRDFAKKPSILTRLLDSSQQTSGTPVAAVGGPGGRHDNDFDDFREISILPTADEILCQQPPFIRPSSVLEDPDGEATRTDMLYEMREEIQTAIGQKKRASPILKHQSLVCILSENQIISLASVNRVEALLAEKPPVIPVLKALQKTQVIPLSEELLFWKDGNIIGSAAVTAARVTRPLAMNPSMDLKRLLELSSSIVLDKSQAASLLAGLTQKLSLIQGPPGTGKSFIGALLAKAIHDHTEQKILVVCYTNHALDQFLEDLMKIGIPDTSMVRLGSRANAQVAHLGIAGQKKEHFSRSKADWAIINNLKASSMIYCRDLETAMGKLMASKIDFMGILTYIEFREPTYFNAFHVPEYDDWGMTRIGKDGKPVDAEELIVRWTRGFDAGQFKTELNVRETQDIWTMPPDARRKVMERWKSEIYKILLEEICTLGTDYNECQDQLMRRFGEARVATLMGKRIIGCTTTGAAMFAQDIRAANPDVLLVEEAGEILESHVLTALGQNTSQMILIGDHQQLRPKVSNYKLTVEKGDGFELNRSLFERLVLKGFPHETLTVQHRMRPEISAFIRKLTYPDLMDAPKTRDRDDIRGVRNNIIFIDHTHLEDNDSRISDKDDEASSGSKQNTYEVEMVWKIVRYLAQQGYGTERLVVLTPYLGQLSKLQDALKRDNDPVLNDLDSHDLIRAGLMSPAEKTSKKRIRLATIDNYQGEESDIVIASLTRSNESNDIGFMNSPERLNVLISRARDGLILIGNSQTFINARKGRELWGKFFELVKQGNYMYEGFPIKCERHPHRKVLIKSASEFDTLCPNGGCTEICGIMLNCGVHLCPLKCHQISDHSQMPCQHPYLGRCPVNHQLKWKCHQSKPYPCPVCVKEAERAEEKRKRELELELKQKQLDAIVDVRERADALEQKIKDIDPARANAQKATARVSLSFGTTNLVPPTPPSNLQSNVPPPNPTLSSPPPKLQPTMKPSTTQTPSDSKQSKYPQPKPSSSRTSTSLMNASPELAARQDLLHQKQVNGKKNNATDGIMELTGLEDVEDTTEQLMHQLETARIRRLEAKAAREKALAALKKKYEEEERKREEVQVQQSLQQMGVCPGGHCWIKLPQGYRCACGTHFMSNDQLMRQQEAALKKKQEDEERKREEAQVQQRLQQLEAGVCSAGYRWIKQSQGYRCADGTHFISNDQLMRQQEAAPKKKQEEEERKREEAQVQQRLCSKCSCASKRPLASES